jgi:hypothetical protein
LVEDQGFSVEGDPDGCDLMDTPLFLCGNCSNSKGLELARYLHGKGAKGYNADMAVECGDLDRLQEITIQDGHDFDEGGNMRTKGLQWLDRCSFSGNREMARWFHAQLGGGDEYTLEKAIALRDQERIEELSTQPDFNADRVLLRDRLRPSVVPLAYTNKEDWVSANGAHNEKYHIVSMMKGNMSSLQLTFPLMAAVRCGNVEAVRWLVKRGADLERAFDFDGKRTPVRHALEHGTPELLQCLLGSGATPPWAESAAAAADCMTLAVSAISREGESAMAMAKYLCCKHAQLFSTDMPLTGHDGSSLLEKAAGHGWADMVSWLVKEGNVATEGLMAKAISSSSFGGSAPAIKTLQVLLLAGEKVGPSDINNLSLTMESHMEVLRFLHSKGIDVTAADEGLLCTLHQATEIGNVRAIIWLLTIANADPDFMGRHSDSATPVKADDSAVFTQYGCDHGGGSELGYACEYGINLNEPKVAQVKSLFAQARLARAQSASRPPAAPVPAGFTKFSGGAAVGMDLCDKCKAAPATKTCSKCKAARYCSRECQLSHWTDHKKTCTCTRCCGPCGTGQCQIPHPPHMRQDMGKTFADGEMVSDFNCGACGKNYSEVKGMDGGDDAVPKIRGAKWCFSGSHATRALPASDTRRILKGTVALQIGPNLQRELDALPADVETLTVNSTGYYEDSRSFTLNPQPYPLLMLKNLQLVDICFEKICLTVDTAPNLRSLRLQNVPDDCNLQISLPELRCVIIHYWHGDQAVVNEMLQVATQLETFDAYKLWVYELEFASNALVSVDLHRSDSLDRLTLWAPNLRSLGLQGCFGIEQLVFLETHALATALPTGYTCDQPLEVNTKNANLSKAAERALSSHPRVVGAATAHRGMPTEGMFAQMAGGGDADADAELEVLAEKMCDVVDSTAGEGGSTEGGRSNGGRGGGSGSGCGSGSGSGGGGKKSSSATSPVGMATAAATAEQAMRDLLLEEDDEQNKPAGKKKSKKGKKKKKPPNVPSEAQEQVEEDGGESAPMTDSAPMKMVGASSDTAALVSSTQTRPCWKCKAAAQFQCGRCKSACYCGPKCQATHWKKHKAKCIPSAEKGSKSCSLAKGGSSSGHAGTNTGSAASESASCYEDEAGGGGGSAAPLDAPAEFTCLLTHGVMQDPVMDPEGNTYERCAIEQWLQVKPESPVTRAPMTAAQLVPNRALRSLIEAYLSSSVPGAASEPAKPAPAPPVPLTVPERIQALETMWGIAHSTGSYIARVEALVALIGVGQRTAGVALPARITVLEQFSGLLPAGAAASEGAGGADDKAAWACGACTFQNKAGSTQCEICGGATSAS